MDARVEDDGLDEGNRGDVESRVVSVGARGGPDGTEGAKDLVDFSLLNRDLVAVVALEIDGRDRSDGVEGNTVVFGDYGEGVGTDLVGEVAVGGDAVGSNEDALHLTLLHEMRRHVVANNSVGDTLLLQLEGSEATSLQKRTCLVHVHVDLLSLAMCLSDDTQRGSNANGRQ